MLDAIKNLLRRPPESPVLDFGPAEPVMRDEPAERFLWLDLPGAGREIDRRQRAGEIDEATAERLAAWRRDGYVILERCLAEELVDAALEDVDRAWRERRRVTVDLLTTGERALLPELDPSARAVPHKLNDLYVHSDAVRRVFLHERIVEFAELVFGDRVVGCNSLTFEFGSQQPAHVDHVYMTPTPARRLVAAWVACEDVRPEAGPLELWAGSHRLPPYDFGSGQYHFTPEQDAEHTRYLARHKDRFPKHEFLARKGDVLLWHPMLIHGGGAIRDPGATRRSMAFHYFSRECIGDRAEGVASHGRALYFTKDG